MSSQTKMPKYIHPLVLPSPLHLIMHSSDDDKRPRQSKTKKKIASFVVETDDMDISEDSENPVIILDRYENDRYIPNFDINTSRCWWDWVPYQLDDNGEEKFDLESQSENAWNAFHTENARREALQNKWWDQNPQK